MKTADSLFLIVVMVAWGTLYSQLYDETGASPSIERAFLSAPAKDTKKQMSSKSIKHDPAAAKSESLKKDSAQSVGPFRQPPTVATLREEVNSQPHSAPISLLPFAEQMSQWMALAETDAVVAEDLMSHLETCLISRDSTPTAVQAYCWDTASRLSAFHHGQLKDRFRQLDHKVSPETRKLLDLYGILRSSAS
jgi:hypothetical protein